MTRSLVERARSCWDGEDHGGKPVAWRKPMARAAQWKTVRGPTGSVSNLLKDLFGVELAYMERAQSAFRAADGLSTVCPDVVTKLFWWSWGAVLATVD